MSLSRIAGTLCLHMPRRLNAGAVQYPQRPLISWDGAKWTDAADRVPPDSANSVKGFLRSCEADTWLLDPRERSECIRRALNAGWHRADELLMQQHPLLDDAFVLVVAQLRDVHHRENLATAKKAIGIVNGFARYARGVGVWLLADVDAEIVEDYCWLASHRYGRPSDVSSTTAANRQAHLRTAFQILADLGLWPGDNPVGKPIRRGKGEASRPLTAKELERVRAFAETGLFVGMRSLLVALAEAGGSAEEIAAVRAADINLDESTVSFTGEAARTNPMTEWGASVSRAIAKAGGLRTEGPLCVTEGLPLDRATHSVTVRLRDVIRSAGLASKPLVTARSIRLASAEQVRLAHGIEAAARFLGNNSLDATAAALAYRWKDR